MNVDFGINRGDSDQQRKVEMRVCVSFQGDLIHAGVFWPFHLGMSKNVWVKSNSLSL